MEKITLFYAAVGNVNHLSGCGENWQYLVKLRERVKYNKMTPTPQGLPPRKHSHPCPVRSGARMLRAALFVMVKNWKQSEYATGSK